MGSLCKRLLDARPVGEGGVRRPCASNVKPKPIKKKRKDLTFAQGVELLGADMNEHIQKVIDVMREISDELGLSKG